MLAAATLLVLARSTGLEAGDDALPEPAIKAVYLYNFALYTQWPLPPADGVGICIAGRDPFGSALAAIDGKAVRGQPVIIRRLDHAADDFSRCHVLYVGGVAAGQGARIARTLRQQPVLTVAEAGDSEDFPPMILLIPDGKRIAFEIDLGMTRTAGLVLSSQLLRLARAVH